MLQNLSRLSKQLSRLSITELYGLVAAFLVTIWLLYTFGRHAWLWAWKRRYSISLHSIGSSLPKAWRSFLYIHLPGVLRHFDIADFHQISIIAILFTANMVVLAYEAESWMTAQRRAGSLAVIHVIPLCLGINFGFPADLLHLDRQTMAWLHRWIGRICVLHSLFHGSLMVSISRTSTLTVPIHIIPIIVRKRRNEPMHSPNLDIAADLSRAEAHLSWLCQ